jgi:ectoine hydroxylase-related dioxygenase (phytanoyl-CoA dioxygenase family)
MIPVPVDQRCEFLSDAWLEVATAYLRERVAADRTLAGVHFALSEYVTHAPPALADDTGGVGWHFRIANGNVAVGSGALESADLAVEAPYQALLGYAQLVYSAGDDAVARGQRELVHRFGADAVRVINRTPTPAPVAALLNGLHDFLVAHTVENPDYEHRVRVLGLAEHVRQIDEQGYTIVERAISPDFADALCERTAKEVTDHHPITTNGLLLRDRMYEEIALNSPVRTVAERGVGQNMILGAMSGTWKLPGPGAIPVHADYPLVREPYPEFGLIAVAVWTLQDWDDTAVGPTWVVPGSHRERRAPRTRDDTRCAVPILMPKGSALVMCHGIWHWQGDRSAPGARVAIHVTYNRVFVRQLDDLRAVGDEHFARNPPAFSTLLGQDDPFGKSSFRGHDGKRFAYAGRFVQT